MTDVGDSCVFCAIAEGTAEADIVFASDAVVVFRDLNPQAPVHLLAIPRQHVRTLNDAEPATVAALFAAAVEAAKHAGCSEQGYRTVINVNRQAGQSVWHLHLHILGGRPLRWPPG